MKAKSSKRFRSVLIGLALALGWTVVAGLIVKTICSDHEQYLGRIGSDIDAQHTFLHRRLHHGGALPMRTLLTHTFYGFSLVDSVLLAPDEAGRRARAVAELRWILERLDDDALRERYHDTQVHHGVYYLGQRNLTLAGLLLIDSSPLERHVREFHAISRQLFEAFAVSPIVHLESYPEHVWPADNIVALYSLAVHDRLYGTNYRSIVGRWIDFISQHLDTRTGLMPYKLDHSTGEAAALPRGVTLAFSIVFLSDLTPEFAHTQYKAFQQHYHDWRLGLLGVREYPRDAAGQVDVDSGPIVLGIGAGANGFALAAARAMEDEPTYASLLLTAEVLGVPLRWRGTKRYLLGYAPIVDAMIVWGKTRVRWLDSDLSGADYKPGPSAGRFTRRPVFFLLAFASGILLFPTLWQLRQVRRLARPSSGVGGGSGNRTAPPAIRKA